MLLNVYAFGSALMDIQVAVQDQVIDELQLQKGHMYLTERTRQGEVLNKLFGGNIEDLSSLGGNVHLAAGGSAANTVYGIMQLGGKATLCGKVARDIFGTLYISDMAQCGVTFNRKFGEGATGTCIVLITADAQRTMLTCLGVSSEITHDDLDEEILKQSKYIYVEGYLFDSAVATETLLKAIHTAKKHNVRVALSASDVFCIERHKEQFVKLIKKDVDLLFANAQEAMALTDTAALDQAVRALAELCSQSAVTDGAHGSLLNFNCSLHKIPAYKVSVLDTTGAGDAYAAGLLFGITNGYSLEASGKIASYLASRVVSQVGPRYTGNIRDAIKNILQ